MTTPDGYRKDAQGRLIPEDQIKPVDKLRDELVLSLATKAKALQKQMRDFKQMAYSEIQEFVELSANEYGTKLGGKKGNVTLLSFDGGNKIQHAVQESLAFDERLQVARSLIDECLQEWVKDARPELAVIVNDAFRVDTKGEIRTARVLSLRRYEIEDVRWQRAMDAIGDACQVVGSKIYLRFYERVGESEHYRPVTLDIAGV